MRILWEKTSDRQREHLQKILNRRKGKPAPATGKHWKLSEEAKEKHRIATLNRKPMSEETKKKMSKSKMGVNSGSKHWNWNNGATKAKQLAKNTIEYKVWRRAVYKRDNFTCQECGDNRGRNLEAHHIKPYSLFSSLIFDINNGLTLCKKCHKKTDSWGIKIKIYAKNIVQ